MVNCLAASFATDTSHLFSCSSLLVDRPAQRRLVDDLGALGNREPKTGPVQLRIRGEARDHDMALQSVRCLDVELPDARVVVVDPDFGARESRVRASGDEGDGVRRASSEGGGAGGSHAEATPRGIQELVGRINRARIGSGVRHPDYLARYTARQVNPERRAVRCYAIAALEFDAQKVGLLAKDDAARRLRRSGQWIGERLAELRAHAIEPRVCRDRAIDDQIGALSARCTRKGDHCLGTSANRKRDQRDRDVSKRFHALGYPGALMPFRSLGVEYSAQSPQQLHGARQQAA